MRHATNDEKLHFSCGSRNIYHEAVRKYDIRRLWTTMKLKPCVAGLFARSYLKIHLYFEKRTNQSNLGIGKQNSMVIHSKNLATKAIPQPQ